MPYTVWCNDRLVGESDLDYIASSDEHWMGDFVPTPYGEQIIPILMGPRQAIVASDAAALQDAGAPAPQLPLQLRAPDGSLVAGADVHITDTEWLLSLSVPHEDEWQADLALAEAELREELDPSEDDDSEQISADPPPWIDEEDDELDEFDVPDLELGEGLPPREFPRYQLQVVFGP